MELKSSNEILDKMGGMEDLDVNPVSIPKIQFSPGRPGLNEQGRPDQNHVQYRHRLLRIGLAEHDVRSETWPLF